MDKHFKNSFKLESIEIHSALWLKLSKQIAERRDVARVKNDNVDLESTGTAFLRGKIAAYKEILGWAEDDMTDFKAM